MIMVGGAWLWLLDRDAWLWDFTLLWCFDHCEGDKHSDIMPPCCHVVGLGYGYDAVVVNHSVWLLFRSSLT
jgi:hypothetical protein